MQSMNNPQTIAISQKDAPLLAVSLLSLIARIEQGELTPHPDVWIRLYELVAIVRQEQEPFQFIYDLTTP